MIGHALRSLAAALALVAATPLLAGDYPPAEPVAAPSPKFERRDAVISRAKELRDAGDTAGLEALADELRRSRESLDGGTWLLAEFYREVVDVPEREPAASEELAFYENWAKQRPDNITAQVCLARALVDHAWSKRERTATQVPKRIRQRGLLRAWRALERARKLEEKCPGWFQAAQSAALGLNWNWSDYFALVDEAIAFEPTYGSFYTNACVWMQPHWHGETGDFEKWIAAQADRRPEEERDRQYAWLVWRADRMPGDNELVFGPGRLDWARTKRGFEKWLAAEPDNLNVRFQLTHLALIADDRETLRAQFDITGGKFYPPAWENPGEFEQARRYAYEGGVNPYKIVEEEPRPAPTKRQQMIAKVLGILSGLAGGTFAGLCLLRLAWQRRHVVAGVLAFVASAALGAAFGTLASIIPSGLLYLHLRRRQREHPPDLAPTPAWAVLLWTIGLAALLIGLQFGAAVLAIAGLIQGRWDEATRVAPELMRDGTTYRQVVAAAWVCFLALLSIVGPRSRAGWMDRLGLHPCRGIGVVLWTGLTAALLAGVSVLLDPLMDETTREALEVMGEGVHSPFWFVAALVIAAPLLEELVFRGYAFSGLVGRLGPWGAILLPTMVFTICHVQYGLAGLAYIFAIGVLLGALRWTTGSVYPCIAVHMANNLVQALMMFRGADGL